DEGVKHLDSSANSIERLVAQDPANVNLLENRIKIFRLHALGYAQWSADSSSSLSEREQRANLAQQHLDHAEALLTNLPVRSLRDSLNVELQDTRKQVAAARASLAQNEATPSEDPRGEK